MKQDKIAQKLNESFAQYKEKVQLKISFEELEQMLFLKDLMFERGYVPEDLGVTIRGRAMDLYNSWYGYMHGIFFPNPQSIPMQMEMQFFSDEYKQELNKLMHKTMHYLKWSYLLGLKQDKQEEARFIEETYDFWIKTLKPKMASMMDISQKKFLEESQKEIKKQKKRPMY